MGETYKIAEAEYRKLRKKILLGDAITSSSVFKTEWEFNPEVWKNIKNFKSSTYRSKLLKVYRKGKKYLAEKKMIYVILLSDSDVDANQFLVDIEFFEPKKKWWKIWDFLIKAK